jgi:transcriptional regulator with XRE-family HTH domain
MPFNAQACIAARTALNLTQHELAMRVRYLDDQGNPKMLREEYLSRYERGKRQPETSIYLAICRVLGANPLELWIDSEAEAIVAVERDAVAS